MIDISGKLTIKNNEALKDVPVLKGDELSVKSVLWFSKKIREFMSDHPEVTFSPGMKCLHDVHRSSIRSKMTPVMPELSRTNFFVLVGLDELLDILQEAVAPVSKISFTTALIENTAFPKQENRAPYSLEKFHVFHSDMMRHLQNFREVYAFLSDVEYTNTKSFRPPLSFSKEAPGLCITSGCPPYHRTSGRW